MDRSTEEPAPARGQPRRRRTLTDTLSVGILNLARGRGLGPGDPMPNAKALAERFEVATPTIREALRGLEATGSIELRHGSGIFVGANLGRIVLPNPHADEASVEIQLQMLDARLLIEPGLARLAAGRAQPPEQVAALRQTLEVAERHEPQDPRAFHRRLARASGNTVLYECVDALLTIRWRAHRRQRRLVDDRARDRDLHQQILDAVVAGDADRAGELTHRHLAEIRSVVAEGATASEDEPATASADPNA